YQSAMRQQVYQAYANLMGDLDVAASICYQRWQGEVADMQGQLLPLIAIGFGFASLGQGLAEGVLQNQFLVPAIEAADFMSHVRDYASHSVTFSAQSLFDCGDIHLLWWYLQQPVAPSSARQLRGAVSSVLNDLTVVLTDLPTGDRSKVTAELALDLPRDVHRAELRPAHRTELGRLEVLGGQGLVVQLARPFGIEREAELLVPVERVARPAERVVAVPSGGAAPCEVRRVRG